MIYAFAAITVFLYCRTSPLLPRLLPCNVLYQLPLTHTHTLLSKSCTGSVVCWRLARRKCKVKDDYMLLPVIQVYFYICRHLGLEKNRWISMRVQARDGKNLFRGKEKKGRQILWRTAGLWNNPVCWTAERRTG